MTKAELRSCFLAERRTLSATEVQQRSELIAERFFNDFHDSIGTANVVHTFLPITRQNEVDTWPIIRRIWRDFPALQIATSVTDTSTHQLTHYILTSDTLLTENKWSIPEPVIGEQRAVSSQQIDVVLVPLLVFDRRGHRVGYGKGYYDRFLAECRPECRKIGLSLFELEELISDVTTTDVALDECITAEHTYAFRQ